MLNVHDKIKLVKPMGAFKNVGEICEIIDIADECISFKFGNRMHLGCMSMSEFEKYFEKVKPVKTTVTQADIDALLRNADVKSATIFDKCTVVAVKLENGFVITESSACVDPANYDKEVGVKICMKRIVNKLWELEGYKLQCQLEELHTKNNSD